MSNLQPILTRMAYVTTENTGGSLDVTGPEGQLQLRRADPHGVVLMFNGQQLSIHADLLPAIGRYFFGAAMALGMADTMNDGWDTPNGQQLVAGS